MARICCSIFTTRMEEIFFSWLLLLNCKYVSVKWFIWRGACLINNSLQGLVLTSTRLADNSISRSHALSATLTRFRRLSYVLGNSHTLSATSIRPRRLSYVLDVSRVLSVNLVRTRRIKSSQISFLIKPLLHSQVIESLAWTSRRV